MPRVTPTFSCPVFDTFYNIFSETSKQACLSDPPHAVVFNRLVNSKVATISLVDFKLAEIYYDITEKEKREIQTVTIAHKQELLSAFEKMKTS